MSKKKKFIMPKKKPKQEQLDKFTVDKNEINIPL